MKKKHLLRIISMTLAFALTFSSMDMTGLAAETYEDGASGKELIASPDAESEDDSESITSELDHGTEPETPVLDNDTESETPVSDNDTESNDPELDADSESESPELGDDTESESAQDEETDFIDHGDVDAGDVSENDLADTSIGQIALQDIQDSESIVASGTCGEGVNWTLYGDGLLRISGTGYMDTSYDTIPWQSYRDTITKLEISDGVTNIGQHAFRFCRSLNEVVISDSVTYIGEYAFWFCENLSEKLIIPNSVKSIGSNCFGGCSTVREIYLSNQLTVIGHYGLYIDGLRDIYYDGTVSEWNAILKRSYALPEDAVVHIAGSNLVKFDSRQGSKVCSQPVEIGQLIIEPEEPTRGGFNFTGWYTVSTDQTDRTKWNFDTDTVSGDLTLYAGWSNKEVTVYFDANGGQLEETSSQQVVDTYYTDLPTPTRYGYTFDGWYDQRSFGKKISATSKVLCTDYSYTLYARWVANKYKVTFDPAGGRISYDTRNVTYGSLYSDALPYAERDGYEFIGWFTSKVGGTQITSSSRVSLAEDHILYAQWRGKTYWVTFDARGGKVSPNTISVTNGLEYGKLPVPTKDNCTFDGWYTEIRDGSQINADTEVFLTSDKTLYAHWQGDERTVYFNANGGEMDISSLKVSYNAEYGYLPSPTKEGYTFVGWFTDAANGDEVTERSIVDQESDLTLYAHWIINEYTVILHANGGSFDESDVAVYAVEHGNTIAQYEGPKRYCWLLTKWTDISGQEYLISDPVFSDLELYAQWEKKYTVEQPVANVKEGEVVAGTRVILSTATNGAAIYYTLDGTVPTTESYLYDDAIVIAADITINAIAVKEDYNPSENVSFTYTIKDESGNWGDITDEDKTELGKSGIVSASQVPKSFWIAGISDRDYTGKAITFDNIHVYYHKTLLRLNFDYTIKYANNINAASSTDKRAPSITITGKGNYSDRITKTFSINKLDLGDGVTNSTRLTALNITLANTGKVQKGTTVVTYDINGNFVMLKSGKDFTYSYLDSSYGAYKNTGEYIVTLTGKGNYTGTATFKETISNDKKLVNKMTFAKVADQAATGKAVEPDLVIKDGSYILQKGKDYTLSYQNNINVGTANVIVTGMGDYSGTKMVNFKISAVAMKKVSVSGIVTKDFTGSEITQTGYTLTYKAASDAQAEVLSEGSDYTVSYINNIKAGKNKAMVVFTGKGRFAGTIKTAFSINARSIQDADVTPSDLGLVAYQKKGTKPRIAVTVDDTVLKENIDYVVKYSNNTDVNDGSNHRKLPTATVTGKGNYSGTVIRTFKIGPGSLNNATMTATDIVYQNKCGICKPNVKIVDSNGNKLAAGTDYLKTLTYTYNKDAVIKRAVNSKMTKKVVAQEGDLVDSKDIISVGTEIKVTATGINKYAGSTLSTTFRYIVADLSKATVKIPDQTFTGDDIELEKDQITVTLNNSVLDNTDYEIVGYSKNRDKGNATVVLHGIGNYSGTKSVTFKIVNRSMYYTVLFDANGGKGSMKKMLISAESANLTTNKIKRAGAVFIGWNTRKDGTGIFYSDKQVVYSKNNLGNVLKLYAQWDIINYSITYYTNGGINPESNPAEYNVTSGTVNLRGATKEHCAFAGWYKESNFRTKVTSIKAGSTGNLTLYAKWNPIKYNISFHGNGGSGNQNDMTGLSYGKTYTLKKSNYSRKGYSFSSWNTKADGSGISYENGASVINLGESEGQTVRLYAMWDMDTYNISYVLDGGKNNSDNPVSYTVVTDTILLKDPERDQYTFGGWYKESGHKNRVTNIPKGSAGNLKLYALWVPYQYTVTFNGNGNTGGSMSVKTYKYGTTYTLPANAFKKKDYRFTGWNTESNGKGTAYTNKAKVTNLSSENGGSVTLYAQWEYVPPKTVEISTSTKSKTVPRGYRISVTANDYIYSYNLFKNGKLYESDSWTRTDFSHRNFLITDLPAGTYTLYIHTCSYKVCADRLYSEDKGIYYVQYCVPTYKNQRTYTCKITVK